MGCVATLAVAGQRCPAKVRAPLSESGSKAQGWPSVLGGSLTCGVHGNLQAREAAVYGSGLPAQTKPTSAGVSEPLKEDLD